MSTSSSPSLITADSATASASTTSPSTPKPPVNKDGKPITLPTAGRLGHLTPEETAALEELRVSLLKADKFVPERHDDCTLLRFLRARQFVVAKALDMLLNYETWRAEFGLERLLAEFDFKERPEVMKLYPQYFHNVDKLGRPIYIEHLGALKIPEIKKITTVDRLKQRVVVEYEHMLADRMPVCSIRANKHIEQSCTIIDLDGVSIWDAKSALDLIREISAIASDCYPEIMGTMLIVNAPTMFSTLWSLIKVFLDAKTVEKIEIHSKKGSAAAILNYIEPAHVPKSLGGECDCVAKNCRDEDHGPWKSTPIEQVVAYRTRDVAKNIAWAAEQREKLNQQATPASATASASASAGAKISEPAAADVNAVA